MNNQTFEFDHNEFSNLLCEMLEVADVSKEKLLEKISDDSKIPFDTLKRWLSGKNKPKDYDKICKLAEAMGVNPEDFAGREKEENDVQISMTGDSNGCLKKIVSAVYYEISDFLETYRSYDGKSENNILIEKFNIMFRNFKKLRLDIPKRLFNNLEEFITDYLFMLTGIDNALSLYLDELDMKEESMEFVDKMIMKFCCCWRRDRISKTIWDEYFKLKKYIISETEGIIEYSDPLDDYYIDYEFDFEESGYIPGHSFALYFIKDLYEWLDGMFPFSVCDSISFTDIWESSRRAFRVSVVKNAYWQLEELLSVFIS